VILGLWKRRLLLFAALFFTSAILIPCCWAKTGQGKSVYIAIRTDGVAGSGTKSDPFDGSSASKVFGILKALPSNTHLNFGRGTYQIDVTDASKGFIKSGWKVRGAGEYLTTIQLSGSVAQIAFLTVLSSQPDVFTSNVRITDLTVDCNWANLAHTATTGKTVRTFDGNTSQGNSILTGSGFTLPDIGEVITGPGIPANTWIGTITDSNQATLSSSATANVPVNVTSAASGTYNIASKRGAIQGIGIGGSNNRLERVRVINSYGSLANNYECFALRLGGTDYNGVRKRGANNWMVNCNAELPWGTYSNPFAASRTDNSGVLNCRALGINDRYDGRGWTSGGVNGAYLKNFQVQACRFADTYGVFYQDTGPLDGLEIVGNTVTRGKIGCAIVAPDVKKNIRIIGNNFNLQNRNPRYPTPGIQFLEAPAASNVVIRENKITFDRSGIGVDEFRTLQASSTTLDATAKVLNNIGPLSLASMGNPNGLYRNNRDIHGVSWFGEDGAPARRKKPK
jgi:hypothetical protein